LQTANADVRRACVALMHAQRYSPYGRSNPIPPAPASTTTWRSCCLRSCRKSSSRPSRRGPGRHFDGRTFKRASSASTFPEQPACRCAPQTAAVLLRSLFAPLRSICGLQTNEQPRIRANTVPRAPAFSVFARVRWPLRFSNQSGRTVRVGFPMRFFGSLLGICGCSDQGHPRRSNDAGPLYAIAHGCPASTCDPAITAETSNTRPG
jgi:hypothetical protein